MEEIKRSDIAEKDLFKNIIDSAIQAETVLNSLNKEIGDSVKSFSKLSKEQIKLANFKELQEAETEIKKVNLAYRESLKIQQEEEKLKQTRLRTQRQEETARAKELRQAEQANSLYAQQSKRLNDLRKAYKDMALAGQEGTKSARDMKREIDKLDASLKKADASVGQFQRNVGNYPNTFSKVSSALGQLGVAFSVGTLISGATRTVIEFDQAIADLVSITGASGSDLDFFKKQAVDLGVTVKGGASAVIEAYKLIGSAKPELLENAQALDAVTQSAITLSKASGMDLPSAATALTDAMNQFGASADDANKFINVLGAGAKFGSAEIPQITEALLRFGAVAKTSNVSVEESTALIEDLAEKGLKGADAGTALRNVMLKLSAPDALPKEAQDRMQALGISFDKLRDTSIPFSERLEALKPLLNDNAALVKVFGTENAVAATTLLNTTDRIKELNAQVTGTDTAFVQAEQRTQTLSQAFVEFRGTFEKLILDFTNGTGAGQGFANVLGFITKNLPSIIGWMFKLTAGFVAFKTVQAAVNTDWKQLIANFASLKKGAEDGASSMSGFGNALKGIGWSVAIGLAIDFAMSLYDVASGAQAAREQHEALKKSIDDGSKSADALLKKQQKARDLNIQALNDEAKRTKMSEAEYKKRLKLIEDEYKAKVKGNTRYTNELRDSEQKEAREIAKMLRIYNAQFEKYTGKFSPAQMKQAREYIDALGGSGEAYKRIDALKQSIALSNAELVVYNAELKALNPQIAVMTDFTGKATTANNENAKSVKEQTKNYDEFLKRITGISALLRVETDELNKLIEVKRLELDLDRITETDEAINRRRSNIARIKVLQAEANGNEAEIRKARINEIKEELAIELENIELSETDKQRLILESEAKIKAIQLESLKQTEEAKRKAIDMTTKYFTEKIDQQIAKEDEKIKKSQELANILEQQAINGNIDAEKSLATQKKLQDEAEKNKIKLEQRKRAIELGSAFLQSFNSELASGKNVQQALLSAGATTATLDAFIQTLASFDIGSDEIKVQGGGVDGKGGMMAVIHDGEKIFTKEENKAMGGKSRAEIVDIVRNHDMSRGAEFSSIVKSDTPILNIKPLIEAVKDLQNDIKNRPVSESNIGAITSKMMQIIDTKRTPTTTTNNRFNIRP